MPLTPVDDHVHAAADDYAPVPAHARDRIQMPVGAAASA